MTVAARRVDLTDRVFADARDPHVGSIRRHGKGVTDDGDRADAFFGGRRGHADATCRRGHRRGQGPSQSDCTCSREMIQPSHEDPSTRCCKCPETGFEPVGAEHRTYQARDCRECSHWASYAPANIVRGTLTAIALLRHAESPSADVNRKRGSALSTENSRFGGLAGRARSGRVAAPALDAAVAVAMREKEGRHDFAHDSRSLMVRKGSAVRVRCWAWRDRCTGKSRTARETPAGVVASAIRKPASAPAGHCQLIR